MYKEDYYEILDIPRDASVEEIKRAYRNLARRYHPDINKDPEAVEKFKKVSTAYKILSDPEKRKEYDTSFQVESKPQEESEEEAAEETSSRFKLLAAAIFRVLAVVFGASFLGSLINFLAWYFTSTKAFSFNVIKFGFIFGALAGLIWGIDLNFDITSFLCSSIWNKIYSFFRTITGAISIGYFGGLLGFILDIFLYKKVFWLSFGGFLCGLLVGATLSSDGDTVFKLKSHKGRLNLLFTAFRGILFGLLGSWLTFLIALVITSITQVNLIKSGLFFGAVLGIILGCTNLDNLTAYSSDIPLKRINFFIIILIIAALIFGFVLRIILKT